MFDKPVHFYRGNTMAGIVEDEAYNDPEGRGFVGGFYMETIHLGPAFMASVMNPHSLVGPRFHRTDGRLRELRPRHSRCRTTWARSDE